MKRINTSERDWQTAVARSMRAGEPFTIVTRDKALASSATTGKLARSLRTEKTLAAGSSWISAKPSSASASDAAAGGAAAVTALAAIAKALSVLPPWAWVTIVAALLSVGGLLIAREIVNRSIDKEYEFTVRQKTALNEWEIKAKPTS
jgi:hypothetical protein